MEERIRNYEKFIKKKVSSGEITPELRAYHHEMMANFQNERLIHLIIMLFFVMLTLGSLVFSGILVGDLISSSLRYGFYYNELFTRLPIFLLTLILVVLTIFYVKHYYFLENHIQKLYDVSLKISGV